VSDSRKSSIADDPSSEVENPPPPRVRMVVTACEPNGRPDRG
jgi:hypothetical protein